MATVTSFTAERMLAMEAATIVDGDVVAGHLILTKHDGSTVDAGSVIGPTGAPGVTQAQLDAYILDSMPINAVIDYLGDVVPNAKWLGMTGQTVINAQTLYPTWWSRIPASMKSGANAIMPNTKGKVSVGLDTADTDFDVIGETGGAKTHTLTQAQLPAVAISIDPPATNVSINPPNTAVTINDPGHRSFEILLPNPAGGNAMNTTYSTYGGYAYIDTQPTGITASVDIAPFTSSVDIAPFNSSNLGSGQAHNNVQPYVVFMKIVKVL